MRVAPGHGVVGFYGLSNFTGYQMGGISLLFQGRVGISQELGHCPLFGSQQAAEPDLEPVTSNPIAFSQSYSYNVH